MSDLTLVIGNKNYSSWSLRPWLLLREKHVPFTEIRIPLYQPGSAQQIARYSPAGKVPVLLDGATRVWESLAICEWVAERFPEAGGWPEAPAARALARSVASEMHAGFASLRAELPMTCRGRRRGVIPSAAARAQIDRVLAIWRDCREQHGRGGDFLFGRFGIADAMFAPVAIRFQAYGIELSGAERDYAEAVLALPSLREWVADAKAESEILPQFERGEPAA
jgi:glutathione S-transferase